MVRAHPAPPPMALHVGITGHRALPSADSVLLAERIESILSRIRSVVSEAHQAELDAPSHRRDLPPILRFISSLAEGADRIAASVALGMGYELQCPLPFPRDIYERDFATEESILEFRNLLSKANGAVLELDGEPLHPDDAYLAASRMVLSQCDILVAIWDGEGPRGKAGTAPVIQIAKSLSIPIVWIDAGAPHQINLLAPDLESEIAWEERLRERLLDLLLPSSAPTDTPLPWWRQWLPWNVTAQRPAQVYFRERWHRVNWSYFYELFVRLLSEGRLPSQPILMRPYEGEVLAEWSHERNGSPDHGREARQEHRPFHAVLTEQVEPQLLPYFAWADKLANHYAGLYRVAFLTKYGLASVAVVVAAMGEGLAHLIQALLLCGAALVITAARQEAWHERWVDYRLLAELLRQVRYLTPTGRVMFSVRVPRHMARGEASWVRHHYRLVIRSIGMPRGRLDGHYIEACRQLLLHLVEEQYEYHDRVHRRLSRLNRLLYDGALAAFWITVITSLLRFAGVASDPRTLVVLRSLPAIGGFAGAVRSQGEFGRLTKRAAAMREALALARKELSRTAPFNSESLGMVASDLAEAMVAEQLDWRSVIQGKPLPIH